MFNILKLLNQSFPIASSKQRLYTSHMEKVHWLFTCCPTYKESDYTLKYFFGICEYFTVTLQSLFF